MMAFDLKRILLALLFSSSEALTIKDIQGVVTRYHQQEVLELDDEESALNERNEKVPSLVTGTQIREAMKELERELDESGQVFQLTEGHNGYGLAVRTEFGVWIRCLRGEPKPSRLSQAALETLAIVAYREPTTRAEIESIRGVSADGALNRLLDHDLIEVRGRADLPGRPMEYGITEHFLEFVGIKSREELPASDVLSPREIDKWIQKAAQPGLFEENDAGIPEEESEKKPIESITTDQENLEANGSSAFSGNENESE